jgi:hypothetical protein
MKYSLLSTKIKTFIFDSNIDSDGMGTLFRGITKAISSLFRGIFLEQTLLRSTRNNGWLLNFLWKKEVPYKM